MSDERPERKPVIAFKSPVGDEPIVVWVSPAAEEAIRTAIPQTPGLWDTAHGITDSSPHEPQRPPQTAPKAA